MPKLNEQRVEQFQSGKVVLYTGDKKGSEEVSEVLGVKIKKDSWTAKANFYGKHKNGAFGALFESELNDRPIHTIEWFYEEELTRRLKDFDDGYKEGYQDGISGVKAKY